MSSFILRTVRPSNLQNWVKTNAVSSLKTTPKESWRAFLIANGGTGRTFYDLEQSFLNAQVIAAGKPGQRWAAYSGGAGKTSERCQNKFK